MMSNSLMSIVGRTRSRSPHASRPDPIYVRYVPENLADRWTRCPRFLKFTDDQVKALKDAKPHLFVLADADKTGLPMFPEVPDEEFPTFGSALYGVIRWAMVHLWKFKEYHILNHIKPKL